MQQAIDYREYFSDDPALRGCVYCVWELRTVNPLPQDFTYLVLPDGCIDVVFDISASPEFNGALIMTPPVTAERLVLGRSFAYVGIRFMPGAFKIDVSQIVGAQRVVNGLQGVDFSQARLRLATAQIVPSQLFAIAKQLMQADIAARSVLVHSILNRSFASVADMVAASGYSRRQLQRILLQSTGYTPHDLLKIVRFQRALQSGKAAGLEYADQSHFIRECKAITGMTPGELRTTYHLSEISNA